MLEWLAAPIRQGRLGVGAAQVHADHNAAATGADALKDGALSCGERRPVFVAPPAAADLPKDAKVGTTLVGTVTWARATSASGGGACPAAYPVTLVVPPPEAAKDKDKKEDKDDKEAEGWTQALASAVRDAQARSGPHLPSLLFRLWRPAALLPWYCAWRRASSCRQVRCKCSMSYFPPFAVAALGGSSSSA